MSFLLIPLIACGASLLTFFSGFGLGTLLMPVFAIFFPIEMAIAMTATVHFLNGVFKLILVGKEASRFVLLRFGLPAIVSALIGALILTKISGYPALITYQWAGHEFSVMPVKLVVALLMITFTLFEIIPQLRDLQMQGRYLPWGGVLSGFFGGLSGHQGALRAMFLTRAGLTKEQFVATGAVIASMIDVTRLGVYARHLSVGGFSRNLTLLSMTTLAAFAGAYLGSKLLKKVTMRGVQMVVTCCLFLLALALGMGVI